MGKSTITCPHVGMVDFGEGPVKVRCTKIGPHDEHEVVVDLGAVAPQEGYILKNVFDDDGEDND